MTALAEASRIDDVKDIRDKAVAAQAYARQAKDGELIGYATEIRMRAERRAGELLAEMAKAKGGNPNLPTGNKVEPVDTLSDIGISKRQSSRWQKLAEIRIVHKILSKRKVRREGGRANCPPLLWASGRGCSKPTRRRPMESRCPPNLKSDHQVRAWQLRGYADRLERNYR